MLVALSKAIKWYFLSVFAIIGTSAFIIANNSGSVKPILIGILGYGVVYGTTYFWKDLRGNLLMACFAVFLVISFVSPYVPIAMYILFAYSPASFDPFYTWGLSMGALGIPVVTLIFKKMD